MKTFPSSRFIETKTVPSFSGARAQRKKKRKKNAREKGRKKKNFPWTDITREETGT